MGVVSHAKSANGRRRHGWIILKEEKDVANFIAQNVLFFRTSRESKRGVLKFPLKEEGCVV